MISKGVSPNYITERIICLIDFESMIYKKPNPFFQNHHSVLEFNNLSFFQSIIKTSTCLNVTYLIYYKNPKCRSHLSEFLKKLENPQNVKTHVQQEGDDDLIKTISSLKINFPESYNSHDGIAYIQFTQPHLTKTIYPRQNKFQYLEVHQDKIDKIQKIFGKLLSPIEIPKEVLNTIFLRPPERLSPNNPQSVLPCKLKNTEYNYTQNWLSQNAEYLGATAEYFQSKFETNISNFQRFYGSNFLYLSGITKNDRGDFQTLPEEIQSKIFNYISFSQILSNEIER